MRDGRNVFIMQGAMWSRNINRYSKFAISPINKLIATMSETNKIALWDTETKTWNKELQGHTSRVSVLAFSPNEDLLVSGSLRCFCVWDVRTMTCLKKHVIPHTWGEHIVSFSVDGKILAWVSYETTVQLLRMPNCEVMKEKTFHTPVKSICFMPTKSGNWLACGLYTGELIMWDIDNEDAPVPAFVGHSDIVSELAFSRDGTLLASGCVTGVIYVWDVADGMLLHQFRLAYLIRNLAFNQSGTQLAATSTGGECHLWTICEWSDRNNHLFGMKLKKVIYCLMCVKTHFEMYPSVDIPRLPMQLWLNVFQSLACFPSTDEIILEN